MWHDVKDEKWVAVSDKNVEIPLLQFGCKKMLAHTKLWLVVMGVLCVNIPNQEHKWLNE